MARNSTLISELSDLTVVGAVVIGGGLAAFVLLAAVDLMLMLNGG
jgi:hypothetical protein